MNRNASSYFPSGGLVVLAAAALLLIPWLGETLFYSKGEPREAIVGLSILESGNWILPTNYGGDIPFKPPFLGWLIAALAWLLNGGVVNEFISRLPSALAAIGMICGGYVWARRERGVRFAMIFSFVTLCSFEVFRAALACRLDMVLTACMVGGIYLIYSAEELRKHRFARYLGAWVLLSCAALTKGPVGSLLPCFICGVYLLLRRRSFFGSLLKMLGLALAALLPLAWWGYEAYLQGGDDFFRLMMEENIDRLFSRMSYESHEQPFWYNFVTLAAGLLPWTVLLLAACFNRRRSPLSLPTGAGLLSLCAAVLTVAFYTIPASKRSVYLLPAYPFICYGITCVIESANSRRALRFFAWFMAVLAVLAPIALVALQWIDIPKLATATIPWWGYAVLLLPMACGIGWFCNRHSAAGHLCVTVWAMYLAYVAVGMPLFLNPKSDSRALPLITEGNPQVINLMPQEGYRLYSLNFYLGDKLRTVSGVAEAATYPKGTVLLIPAGSDTTGLSRDFELAPEFLPRSADHRHRVDMAVRR